MVGVPGLEPGTSPLSGVHSNQLSYTPLIVNLSNLSKQSILDLSLLYFLVYRLFLEADIVRYPPLILLKGGDPTAGSPTVTLLRLHPSR